jgi:hypothetical protein
MQLLKFRHHQQTLSNEKQAEGKLALDQIFSFIFNDHALLHLCHELLNAKQTKNRR